MRKGRSIFLSGCLSVAVAARLYAEHREPAMAIEQIVWKMWWAYLLYILLGAAIVYLIFKHMRDRLRMRQKLLIEREKLKNERWLAEEKSRFYGNIAHELKTPLSLIVSPVKELSEYAALDDFARKRVELIRGNSDKLRALIDEFLEFRKIESQNSALRVCLSNLTEFISGIKIGFNHIADQKQIHYLLVDELTDPWCWFDASKLSKVIGNLLSNAFKFTDRNGYIYLFVSQTELDFTITVADSGPGIAAAEQQKIFERFYRSPSAQHVKGMGIGLALVRSLVQLHNGVLELESVEGVGTSISVTIPSREAAYDPSEKAAEAACPEGPPSPLCDLELNGKPLVVLAEDNRELAAYLHEMLSDLFDVRVCHDGNTAYEAIVKLSPDLILSDVKMEHGDGIELCERVKRNIAVSHIPLILLTAMDAPQEVARGYAAGAEDYITKPFDVETLKLKMGNLIGFIRGGNRRSEARRAAIPARERHFIEQVERLIRENIDNPELGGQFICRELAVSRMQLYRKLTACTGRSISEFIRSIRLERARELLEERSYSISEILYRVGFNSPSYFTKTFKEAFGVTPSEYVNREGGKG